MIKSSEIKHLKFKGIKRDGSNIILSLFRYTNLLERIFSRMRIKEYVFRFSNNSYWFYRNTQIRYNGTIHDKLNSMRRSHMDKL